MPIWNLSFFSAKIKFLAFNGTRFCNLQGCSYGWLYFQMWNFDTKYIWAAAFISTAKPCSLQTRVQRCNPSIYPPNPIQYRLQNHSIWLSEADRGRLRQSWLGADKKMKKGWKSIKVDQSVWKWMKMSAALNPSLVQFFLRKRFKS